MSNVSKTIVTDSDLLIPLEDAVTQLGDQGLSAEFIATALGKSPEQITAILRVRRRLLTPEDSQIADGMRALIKKAQGIAMYTLEFGPTEQKLYLVKTLLSAAGRLVGVGNEDDTTDELKLTVENMFATMRERAAEQGITNPALINVESDTTSGPVKSPG